MKLSQQITALRKNRAMSQEELSAKIGVSRQAVSKWESGQSVPDLDKLVRLSELFGVTIDELVKGETPDGFSQKPNAMIFAYIATAINAIGLLGAVFTYMTWQKEVSILLGIALMIIGCTVFGIGMMISDKTSREQAKLLFLKINLWILTFIPLNLVIQFLEWGQYMPWRVYPVLEDGMAFFVFWFFYIAGLGGIEYIFFSNKSKHKSETKE